ncbi:uncharacterized protein [Physcomitrium patens]|uniref:RRM domain-containing protein n=1 Tax=Physcomitrium patens TaxID=3218 RepID=A0A2K1JPC5_PHYPA|nr:heterogeneous nuclear ribonucleoprotein H2-like isoform X2 [Physcomitrium patens]XP_024390304.1 heterogeneous nuclear ribonucleoprotein H2-like isoform X2 [Physcomitrium patens]PNR43387.1 hypothetical protein PHYPA_015767 [Physcomitrium patens]|eukprot:XP_024390303.1 heterogeneous nuclear ribonucleoprotein H2-like isoform X2 [Physcomitrella patens]
MVSKGDRWARSSFRWNYLGGHADQYEVGSKRQRLIDGGSSPVLLQGHPRSLPVVRLRGLPFNCSDSDVFDFFAGLDVVDVLLVRMNGRFSGEAYVVFGAPVQVDYALQKNRHNIGRRYIEVFRCKKQDYYHAVAAEVADTRCIDSTLPLHVLNNNSSSASAKAPSRNNTKDHLNFTGVVKLRGLPFSATKSDVMDFFREFELHDEHVHIMLHSDGRTTGEAFVDFGSASKAKSAMNKDKMTMGSRYVEIFPSSREEATRAATR